MYNGVYSASFNSVAFSTATGIMDLQVPANVQIEVIRAWIGAAEGADPLAEVQEIALYVDDTVLAGTSITIQKLRGSDDATSAISADRSAATTTPNNVYYDAFHLQTGWLYLPVPEERIRVAGGSTNDNVGMHFPVAPDSSITISGGMIWGELG